MRVSLTWLHVVSMSELTMSALTPTTLKQNSKTDLSKGLMDDSPCSHIYDGSETHQAGPGFPRNLIMGNDALLYIAFGMLIWAASITADRWHCRLWQELTPWVDWHAP